MKIAILTQPLHNNYGGLLQAYALQKVLKGVGHDVWTVDIQFKRSLPGRLKGLIGRVIRRFILQQQIPVQPNENEKKIIAQHTSRFVKENIKTTERISSVRQIHQLNKYEFDAYIVGSDQVWRPCYSPVSTFFLDFLNGNEKVKRIAYAASFGVDTWEFSPKLTERCKKLAPQFDAISVREDSGVTLCKEYLGVDATHVLDPTLLLEKEDYIALIEKDQTPAKPNSLMVYVLDQTPEKTRIIEKVRNQLGLEINSVMPKKSYNKESRETIADCIYPSVTQWLRGFMDAEFVVTDSFHGTVFSIIFNKPFIVIGNESRGMSRFISLLKKLKVEDRLIFPNRLTEELITNPIDWDEVNSILDKKRIIGTKYLEMVLN